jgi:predicted PurR-regulated permease PerM
VQAATGRNRFWVWIGCALLVAAMLYALRGVLAPVILAFFLAYVLDPLADHVEALKVPRGVGVMGLLILALLLGALLVFLVLPAVVRDLVALISQLPVAVKRAIETIGPWLQERGIEVPATGADAVKALEDQLANVTPVLLGSVQSIATSFLGSTASIVAALAAITLFPVLTAYLLLDFDRITAAVSELIPPRYREATLEILNEVDEVLGLFVRGQLLVMAALGALLAVGYAAVGVTLAVPIGIIGGLLSFIPYVGGAVALGLGLLMSLLHYDGMGQLIGVVAVYTAVQLLEGFVITPYIVGDKLGMSALVVLFALMIGGELFGFLGVMLALPVAAIIKVFVTRGLVRYRASAIYVGIERDTRAQQSRLRLRAPLARRMRARRRLS